MINQKKMPLAGSDPGARALAHMRSAARYSRSGRASDARKAVAHFNRAVDYAGLQDPLRFGQTKLDELTTRVLGATAQYANESEKERALYERLFESLKGATVHGESMYSNEDVALVQLAWRVVHTFKFGPPYPNVTKCVEPDKKTGRVALLDVVDKFRNLSQSERNLHAKEYGPMCVWDVGGPSISFYVACSVNKENNDHPFHSDLYWDTSAAMDMRDMFGDNHEFHGDLSAWDVRKVAKMDGMFSESGIVDSGIGRWNVSELVTADSMFSGAKALSAELDLSRWDVRKCMNLSSMFSKSSVVDSKIGTWKLHDDATVADMFWGADKFEGDLSGWSDRHRIDASIPKSKPTLDELMTRLHIIKKGTAEAPVKLALHRKLVASLKRATVRDEPMYGNDDSELTRLATTTIYKMDGYKYAKVIDVFKDREKTGEALFEFLASFTSLDLHGRKAHAETYGPMCVWDVSGLEILGYTDSFLFDPNLFNSDLYWDTSAAIDMRDMFFGNAEFHGDLATWDVSKVIAMDNMFTDSGIVDSGIGLWDVSELVTAECMFTGAQSLSAGLDLSRWDVRKCTNLSGMFSESSVVDGGIGKWELGPKVSVRNMLLDACEFKGDLSKWGEAHLTAANATKVNSGTKSKKKRSRPKKRRPKKPPGVGVGVAKPE